MHVVEVCTHVIVAMPSVIGNSRPPVEAISSWNVCRVLKDQTEGLCRQSALKGRRGACPPRKSGS